MTTSQPDGGSRLAVLGMWTRLWSAAARSRACWRSAHWLLLDRMEAVGKPTGRNCFRYRSQLRHQERTRSKWCGRRRGADSLAKTRRGELPSSLALSPNKERGSQYNCRMRAIDVNGAEERRKKHRFPIRKTQTGGRMCSHLRARS